MADDPTSREPNSPLASSGVDPFAVLGLSRRFDLAPADVQRAFLVRSSQLHPDVAGDDAEALDAAAELNRAREILENPESRADVLLRLLGGPTREQERSLPPGFLQEMMEVREAMQAEMEAARGSGDSSVRQKWIEWARERRRGHEQRVAEMFAAMIGSTPAAVALKAVRTELNAWRYIERMMEQV